MKNIIFLITLLGMFSCSNDVDSNIEPVTIEFSVNASGILTRSSQVEYGDMNGEIQIEPLTGDWSKSMIINSSNYKLYLKLKGGLQGEMIVNVTAEGNGNNFDYTQNRSFQGTSPEDFEIFIETTLE